MEKRGTRCGCGRLWVHLQIYEEAHGVVVCHDVEWELRIVGKQEKSGVFSLWLFYEQNLNKSKI